MTYRWQWRNPLVRVPVWPRTRHEHGMGKHWDGKRYTCTEERPRPFMMCVRGFTIGCVLESEHQGLCLSSAGFERDMRPRPNPSGIPPAGPERLIKRI